MSPVSIQLSSLPFSISFYPNGCIAINHINMPVETLIDGVAMYDSKGFSVGCSQYFYGTLIDYKQEKDLLEYLKSLQLDVQQVYNAFAVEKMMQEQMNNFHFKF